jgi:DNA transformation protein
MPPKSNPEKKEPPESVHRLARVMPIRWRSMFGGFGIYFEETLFGIVSSKERALYFRIGETNLSDYEKAGSKPFQPHSRVKGREHTTVTMPYRLVPEKVLDKPATLRRWAEKALDAAHAARAKRGPKPVRKPPKPPFFD